MFKIKFKYSNVNSNLFYFLRKNAYGEHDNTKSVKWYLREKFYDMDHNTYFKNYLIKRRENKEFQNTHIELIPIKNENNCENCLIWLYDGDWPEMMLHYILEANNFPPNNFKIVLYSAPFNPISFESIILQNSWFNIFDLPDVHGRRDIDKKEIDTFNKIIHREIKDQYNLIGDYKKIFLAGFSQSACMALYSTMTYKENLGGVIAFSGFNFDFTPLDSEKKDIPVLAINGIKDEIVLIRHARSSYQSFIKHKFNLKLIEEPGLYHYFSTGGLNLANKLLQNKNLLL